MEARIVRRQPFRVEALVPFPTGEDIIAFQPTEDALRGGYDAWVPVTSRDILAMKCLVGQPVFGMDGDTLRLQHDPAPIPPADMDPSLTPDVYDLSWPIGQTRPQPPLPTIDWAAVTQQMADAMANMAASVSVVAQTALKAMQAYEFMARYQAAVDNAINVEIDIREIGQRAGNHPHVTDGPSRHERRKAQAIQRGKSDKPRPDRRDLKRHRGW